jgi:hypothetical protein
VTLLERRIAALEARLDHAPAVWVIIVSIVDTDRETRSVLINGERYSRCADESAVDFGARVRGIAHSVNERRRRPVIAAMNANDEALWAMWRVRPRE